MRMTLGIGGLVLILVALGMASLSAQENRTKDVMRFKLHYAQGVLEGITTENFDLIATNAAHLQRLSQAAGWTVRQTEEYQRFTLDFRRAAEGLERAAQKKNVEAATVAYFQLTVSCVSCHRYLRDSRLAGVPSLEPSLAMASIPAVGGRR